MARKKAHHDSDSLERAKALMEAGDSRGAVALLRAQLALGGGLLNKLALGRALLAANEIPEALKILRDTVELAPGIPDAALALGEALLAAGHLPTAIAELQRALRLDPAFENAQYTLGCAWLEAGEADQAREALAKLATSESPFASRAAEKIAQAEAMQRTKRAAAGYVRHLFDQFSAGYDQRMLEALSYRAPLILRELADLVLAPRANSLAILDLGCGTGMAGVAFRDVAKRLDGLDLSPRMIEKTRERGIYHTLAVADLEADPAGRKRRYDVVLAADTLVYLGDLSRTFAVARAQLRAFGHFLFTVEAKPGEGFELGPKRRYRHSEIYLREEAASAGFEVMGLLACSPRTESNAPVEGFAVALQAVPA